MWRSTRVGCVAGLLIALPACAAAREAVTVATDATTVSAVWVEHDLEFSYTGVTSKYSCDGLRDRVSEPLAVP